MYSEWSQRVRKAPPERLRSTPIGACRHAQYAFSNRVTSRDDGGGAPDARRAYRRASYLSPVGASPAILIRFCSIRCRTFEKVSISSRSIRANEVEIILTISGRS
jgi:hypothetical protein